MVVFRRLESVLHARYFSICNILCLWSTQVISLTESTDSMISTEYLDYSYLQNCNESLTCAVLWQAVAFLAVGNFSFT